MKSAFLVRQSDGSFMAAWSEDADALAYLRPDDIIEVQFRRPRNPGNHRRFFKMLSIAIENFPEHIPSRYHNPDYLRKECLIGCGYCDWNVSFGGKEWPEAHSMDFASMDETKFREVYSDVVDYILKHFLKGADKEDLLHVVEQNINLFA